MRNSDGRFRNHNKPTVVSAATLRTQWIDSEATCLKRKGFSYKDIADLITQVGRAQKAPVTPLPDGVTFPTGFKRTPMGCHKAVKRALRGAPTLEANEMRRIDTDRCDEMYLYLTPGIRQGDPPSVKAAVSALAHKAAINGYKSSENEIRIATEVSWSSVLPKEQSIALYKEAMMLLLQSGLKVQEFGRKRGSRSSVYRDHREKDRPA
jgi:hypothetical protein